MLRHFFLLATIFVTTISALQAEIRVFPFSDDPIDVVIPCVEKDLLTLNLCIHGIRENGANIRRIIVISQKPLTSDAEWFNEANFPFSFQEITAALPNPSPPLPNGLLLKQRRTGWYYQQLLKLYSPLVIPNISSNVLVLDSDTIFLKPVTFLNQLKGGMYNSGQEYHVPYFQHTARLIPGFYKHFPNDSGICHHMIFQRPLIEALFEEVEYRHNKPFWQIFCELVSPNHVLESGASEYELYFNYAFTHSNQLSHRRLKWRDVHRFSEIQQSKAKGLDYVSLHSYHRIID